jgi:hypothetical protein
MIRRTLKKKPSLVKNKTGKRKNTKGIKRNRRKVHKTRKRKGGDRRRIPTILSTLTDPAARLFYKGLYNAGQAARHIKNKLKKMPKEVQDKYGELYDFLSSIRAKKERERARRERAERAEKERGYRGGEESEHLTKEYIMNLIKNIGHGDDGVSLCDHIKTLTHFREIAENEDIRTALTEKISELEEINERENKGNCENITTEAAEGEEPSADSAVEETTSQTEEV